MMVAPQDSGIAALLRSRASTLEAEWLAFAKTRVPAALTMSEDELRRDLRGLLRAVGSRLDSRRSPMEGTDTFPGAPPAGLASLEAVARAHAADRVQAGFTLEHIVSEFQALRASVFRLIEAQGMEATCTFADLARFDEAIDHALSVSAAVHGQMLAKARDLFIAVLGHDLRDPLSTIKISANQLLMSSLADPECERLGQQIVRSTLRMTRMMDDLLDFTRARAGLELPLEARQINFADICRMVVAESSAAYPATLMRVDCPATLVGKWDDTRLGQMVANLLANAVAHGAPGRPVDLTLRDDDEGNAVLTVHNEGRPIQPDRIASLFDPLTRGVHSTSDHATRSTGLGLGLSIVKSIVTAHRGAISIRSSEAEGTSFEVVLPRVW